MKTLFVIVFTVLLTIVTRAAVAQSPVSVCNQAVYDMLYEELLKDTIKTGNYENKTQTVEMLKKLCRNQRFTLEKKNIGARTIKGLPVAE